MTKAAKLKHCVGCDEDFYNGKNPYGIKECWLLKDAKMVLKKEVHIDQVPPWNQKAKRFLSCFRRLRYVYVAPHQTY
jgi:hypothetical protein